MDNVLILAAGRRVELVEAFKRDLGELLPAARVFAADADPAMSAACHVADEAFTLPRVSDPGYADELLDLCARLGVGLVIPTIDTELALLSRLRSEFAGQGTHVIISSLPLIEDCRDKRRTARLFSDLGVPTPQLFDPSEIKYPAFAKPYDGSRSIGAKALMGPGDLTPEIVADPRMIFMSFVPAEFEEYTLDAYFDRTGGLSCLVPRHRLEVRSGEISKGVTRRNSVYDFALRHFRHLPGAAGCVTIQLFAHPDRREFYGIEINPRFGGGYPLSYAAGARYPKWLIEEYLLNRSIPFFDEWKSDLAMLRYDAKVLVDLNHG